MARVRDGDSPLARPHGKRRRPPRPWKTLVFFTLFILLLGVGVAARASFVLLPPHAVTSSASGAPAMLSTDKRAQLDEELDFNRPFDRDQAIDFALDFTAQSLTFAPGHPPSFDFGVGKRKACSTEYAALFAVVFEAASKRAGSTARGWRVQSPVRVFNKVLPLKGADTHDWVLVHDPADGARIYLDPTLSDLFLGSSVTRNVKGGPEIQLPADAPKPSAGNAGK
jgi:hypothetical protein